MATKRSGTWCPAGVRVEDCEVLFSGNSIFCYLHGHIPDRVGGLVPAVKLLSGAKIATLTEECETLISHKLKFCVLHVGINDLKSQIVRTPALLEDFGTLVAVIKKN